MSRLLYSPFSGALGSGKPRVTLNTIPSRNGFHSTLRPCFAARREIRVAAMYP